ncbi:MAG: hypothetical protein H6767_04985 [Candidatus Peribacteria bacterium]|nr:MAG: hypothetical protein H6767_04985 [Candidatus Peribacteria bacterium]
MAGILGDFTKEEVEKEGYMWRDEEIRVDIPAGAEVVYTTPPQSPSILPSPQPSPLGEREQAQSYSPSTLKARG